MMDDRSGLSPHPMVYMALALSLGAFVIAIVVGYVTLLHAPIESEPATVPLVIVAPAPTLVPIPVATPVLTPGIAPTVFATQTPIPQPDVHKVLSGAELNSVLALEGWAQEDIAIARCIAWHESAWHVDAHSLTDPGSGSYGLFQINSWWATGAEPGWDKDQVPALGRFNLDNALEPFYNARYALNIFRVSGWSPWSTSHLCVA